MARRHRQDARRVRSPERCRGVIFIYQMNTPSNAAPESGSGSATPATTLRVNSGVSDPGYKTRPLYWSVWRELWENRSIYIAPLIVAAFQVFGFAISTIGLADRRRAVLLLDPAHQRTAIEQPYDLAAMMMIFVVFIVGVFYCLDALHSERRDRSVLFWKSLPVSDLTAVLAKVSVPILVLPLLNFIIIVPTQLLMLLISSVVLLVNDLSPAVTWANFPLPFEAVVLFYGLVAITLWFAPIYGYFLLVSGWVRRATFLWAVLPFVAMII